MIIFSRGKLALQNWSSYPFISCVSEEAAHRPLVTILKCEFVSAKVSGAEIEQDSTTMPLVKFLYSLYKLCQLNPKMSLMRLTKPED